VALARNPGGEITLDRVDGHLLIIMTISFHPSGDYLAVAAVYKRSSWHHNPDSTIVITIGIGTDGQLSKLGATSLSYAAGTDAMFLSNSDQLSLSSCVCMDNTTGGGVVPCDLSDRVWQSGRRPL
jgi:hypothetical protein